MKSIKFSNLVLQLLLVVWSAPLKLFFLSTLKHSLLTFLSLPFFRLFINFNLFIVRPIDTLKVGMNINIWIFSILMKWLYLYNLSSSHVCGCVRWFLDGMSIGLQTRYMMGTWLSFRVKRRSFFQRHWRVLLMLISSTQTSHLHPPKQIALSWHFEIGWGDMATANLSGSAWATNNLCHQRFFQNVRCENLLSFTFHQLLLPSKKNTFWKQE